MNHLLFTLVILLYVNFIRYIELREYTTMYTLKQYFINMNGIAYNVTIIIISTIFHLLKYLE